MSQHARESDKQPSPPPRGEAHFALKAVVASFIAIAVIALFLFVWYSVYVLFLLFAGVLLAILLRALAEVVATYTRLSHRWSLAIVLVLLAAGLTGFWYVAAQSLIKQVAELSESIGPAWQNFQTRLRETGIGRYALDHFAPAASQPTTAPATASVAQAPPASDGTGGGGGFSSVLLGRFGGFLTTIMDLVAAIVVVVFTGLFLAFDPKQYVRGAIRLVPPRYRLRAGEVLGAMGYTLKWWLIGQGVTMVAIASATTIGLWLLGIPLAFVLGVIAGLFNFIPNFGPLFSMVPATLLALTISPGKAMAVIAMFIVLQNLEGNLLTPLIQRKSVDLPPALGIIAQILLSILVGAVGLMLAWPLAAVVVLGVKMLYVEDVLGDELPTPDDDWKTEEVRDAKREARKVIRDEKK